MPNTSLEAIIDILNEKSRIDPHSGMAGTDCRVDKAVLATAAGHLSDYRDLLERLEESQNEQSR